MSKIVDSIIGLAMGDAMGVPLEFSIRKKINRASSNFYAWIWFT